MAVIEQTPISNFTGNGVTTVFAFDYLVPLNTDLLVIVDGVTQTLGTDYTVTGTGVSSGGTITFTSAPASGAAVTVLRSIPATRSTDYQENGDLLADVLNDDFDRIVLMVQDGAAGASSAVRGQPGETLAALPAASSRIDKMIYFDAADGQDPAVSTFTHTQLASAVAAAYAAGSTADAVTFLQAGAGAVSRSVQDRLRDEVSVLDFGAVGNGTTDDTAEVQAAIDAAAGGGVLVLPKGYTFLVSDTLVVKSDTTITGGGAIKMDDATNLHLIENENYASGSNANIVLDGIILDGNVANQTNNGTQNKHGIRMQTVTGLVIKNCEIKNVGTDCVNLIDCERPEILSNHLHGAYNHAVTFQNTDGLRGIGNTIHDCGSTTDAYTFVASGHAFIGVNTACDDVVLSNNYVYDMGDSCLRNERAGQGWVISDNVIVDSGKDSIKIMGLTGSNPRPKANSITGNVVINAGNDGIVAMGACVVSGNHVFGTGKNTAGAAAGKWFASASGIKVIDYSDRAQIIGNYCQDGLYAGVYISGANDVMVKGNFCYLNGYAGVVSFDSNRVTIEGNDCLDNGVAVTGNGSGVRVSISAAATQDDVSVRFNTCRNTTTTHQGYGVYLSGATTTGFRVQYNDVRGNGTVGVLDSATGSDNLITYNEGFATESKGTATVLNGTTSILVNHGLAITPTSSQVSITPTNNLGSATKFWLSSVTSSQIQISVDVNPGATTATFAWQIE